MNGTYRDAVPQPGATFVINTPRMYSTLFDIVIVVIIIIPRHIQGGWQPGKPGKVREFGSGQEKVHYHHCLHFRHRHA